MEQGKVKKRNGRTVNIDFGKIQTRIAKAGRGLKVNPLEIAMKVVQGVYDGVTTKELDRLAADTAASYAIDHPDYSNLAANIAVSALHKDTPGNFSKVFNKLKKAKLLNEDFIKKCEEYDLNKISSKIDYSRDYKFDYFGFKTLERAYLIKIKDKPLERPQDMYMRVALVVTNTLEDAIETYNAISNHLYTHATPTLFNSGLKNQQLASCFLINNKSDSKEGLFDTIKDVGIISSAAGGIGISISNVRAEGSPIHSTNGTSHGILPYLKTLNSVALWMDQCFDGESEVETNKGFVKMKNLTIDNLIKTSDGNFYPLHEIKSFDYEGEIIEINGNKVTPDHPILVIKYNGESFKNLNEQLRNKTRYPEWIEAKNITKDDLIVKI